MKLEVMEKGVLVVFVFVVFFFFLFILVKDERSDEKNKREKWKD